MDSAVVAVSTLSVQLMWIIGMIEGQAMHGVKES